MSCNLTFGGSVEEACRMQFHRYLDDLDSQACAKIMLLGKYIVHSYCAAQPGIIFTLAWL